LQTVIWWKLLIVYLLVLSAMLWFLQRSRPYFS